jgi:ABC-2 type transport system permease protein
MILHVAKKEMKEIARTGQFKWMLALVILLGAIAIFISHMQWQDKNEQRQLADENAKELWLAQGSVNPHNAAHYGTYAFKPQFPLSLIDPGVEKFTGVSIFLEAHSRNEADMVAAADQTGLSRFGDLTPDFILLFIIPLMIIAIGHNTISKEKELGTIMIIKTQGISNAQFIIGKWVGNFTPIALITTALFLLAALLLEAFDWKLLATMWLIYMAYFAIINSITLVVSSLTSNSGISLVSLLAIWIVSSGG